MGFRKIKPKLIHLDCLAMTCGLFDMETDLNNGYGCKSKSKDKSEIGKCFGFDCPLATEADLEDLEEHDKDLYAEYLVDYQKSGYQPADVGANWMIQYRESS